MALRHVASRAPGAAEKHGSLRPSVSSPLPRVEPRRGPVQLDRRAKLKPVAQVLRNPCPGASEWLPRCSGIRAHVPLESVPRSRRNVRPCAAGIHILVGQRPRRRRHGRELRGCPETRSSLGRVARTRAQSTLSASKGLACWRRSSHRAAQTHLRHAPHALPRQRWSRPLRLLGWHREQPNGDRAPRLSDPGAIAPIRETHQPATETPPFERPDATLEG